MTFHEKETSVDDGAPIYIFEFRYGVNYFRYTSASRSVMYSGIEFEPFGLASDAISQTQEEGAKRLKIQASGRLPVAQLYRVQPPSVPTTLTVRSSHATDSSGEWLVVWKGRVLDAEWTDDGKTVELVCEQISASASVIGLYRPAQKMCPYVTFGFGCELNRFDFQYLIGPFSVAGTLITATVLTTYDPNFFTGGEIEYINPLTNVEEKMTIIEHDATLGTLLLDAVPINISGVSEFIAYPGDDHSYETCKEKFDNRLNYGGFVTMPDVDPYTNTVYS